MNNDEKKELALEIETEVLKLQNSLNSLKESLIQLQSGDESGLYWNGESALKMNKSLMGHLEHDFVLLDNLKKCSDYIKTL